ncbi:MAG: MarR family winged helix-turn-helix transcriptional regulator [Catonella sp.]
MANHYSCGILIKQIHDIMEKNANNVLREEELTISQFGVIVLLDEREGKTSTFKELEKEFGVSQPTMAGILNRLEQKRLVEILGDSEDKRIRRAHLTPKGEVKCKEGYKHMREAEEYLLQSLTKDEAAEFNKLLQKVRKSFE